MSWTPLQRDHNNGRVIGQKLHKKGHLIKTQGRAAKHRKAATPGLCSWRKKLAQFTTERTLSTV